MKPKPKMTINEVMADMREHGYQITGKTLADGIATGAFPFGTHISTGKTGRRTFIILRSNYEAWRQAHLN